MGLFKIFIWIVAACTVFQVRGAQLELVAGAKPESIFSGGEEAISLVFHNAGSETFDHQIRARIFQTGSAMAVPVSEAPWKMLQVLPEQTVLESAQLDFPAVDAETKFLVQWLDETNHVIGVTSVLVYPTNLLQTLQPLLCETNFGVLDPGNQLKPLLKAEEISFVDLDEMGLDGFSGQLAVIGPFASKAQMPDDLAYQVKELAKRNVAVVWIQPPRPSLPPSLDWERQTPQPSFYCVQKNQTSVVVVQPDLVAGLSENPQSQIALIYFCHLALKPQPAVLPDLSQNVSP
jgi:hypothetical protein